MRGGEEGRRGGTGGGEGIMRMGRRRMGRRRRGWGGGLCERGGGWEGVECEEYWEEDNVSRVGRRIM